MASAVDVLDVRITIFVPQSGTRVCRSCRIEQLDQPSSRSGKSDASELPKIERLSKQASRLPGPTRFLY